MSNIEKFYKNNINEILYLELKNNNYNIDYPLPILKKDFVKEVQENTFDENIEFKYFFRGMIYNIAIDPEFKYADKYDEFLKTNILNLENIIIEISIKEIDKNLETANIFLKYGFDKFNNTVLNYYYANTLIELYKELKEDDFIVESKRVLNKNIVIDKEYPLNYLKLGDIELYENNLVKANYYYLEAKKLLDNFPQKDLVEKELDYKLDSIKSEVLYLEVENLFSQMKFSEIIELLENTYEEDYRKYYYLGNSYFHLQDYDKAFKNYGLADEYKNKSLEFYIDYGYFLSQVGYVELALNTIEEGLKEYEDNETLLFNRAIIYINIGENDKAKDDLTKIVEYYDISDEIFNNAMILLEQIQDL